MQLGVYLCGALSLYVAPILEDILLPPQPEFVSRTLLVDRIRVV